jgi:hypothetical protein
MTDSDVSTDVVVHDNTEQANKDFEYARETLFELVEHGRDAIDEMLDVAKNSEHPRAYEVLSGLIKNIADVNEKLLILHKDKVEFDNETNGGKGNNITNNNVFVGSTAELQKLLGKQREEINISKDE